MNTLYEDYLKCHQNIVCNPPTDSSLFEKLTSLSQKIDIDPSNTLSEQKIYIELSLNTNGRKNSNIFNYVRKSLVFIKYSSHKNWNEKLLLIDYLNKKMSIFDDPNTNKPRYEFNILNLNVNWLGNKWEKHCFMVENENNDFFEFRTAIFGFNAEKTAYEWYELIQKIIKESPEIQKNPIKQIKMKHNNNAYSDTEDYESEKETSFRKEDKNMGTELKTLIHQVDSMEKRMNRIENDSEGKEEEDEFQDCAENFEDFKDNSKAIRDSLKPKSENHILENEVINRADFRKILEMIDTNEHSIRSIKKKSVMTPLLGDFKHQSVSEENGGHYVLNNFWTKGKDGGLFYHNNEHIDAQRRVMGFLLKKLGSNIIQGRSIMNISMPVDIFDTTSFLERLAYSFTNVPLFLEKAAQSTDLIQQMKYSLGFILTLLHMSIHQTKPFNPILGETFQGRINGCPIYLEQISHHPPISAILFIGNGYKIQGHFEVVAALRPNSMTGKQLGSADIIFNNGRRLTFTLPPCEINGFAFGPRYLNYGGKCLLLDRENLLAAELSFNPDKKGFIKGLFSKQQTPADFFEGGIYRVNPKFIEKIKKIKCLTKYGGLNRKEDILEEYSVINGVWHEYLEIDGEYIWKLEDYIAYELEYETNPLPSDSIYREDANVWKSKDVGLAQIAKEKLENIQRADRKLREKFSKTHK